MFSQQKSNEELQAMVRALSWNDAFGCFTRAGFEKVIWPEIAERARWIIYFDLNNIHHLNEAHGGYDAVDGMVHRAFSSLRFTDFVAGQFKSGDEFLVCLTEAVSLQQSASGEQRERLDPYAVKDRLIDALQREGLTATFAIVEVTSNDLLANVKPAIDEVYSAKKSRGGRR
jgi:hypothetical protein